MKKRTIIVAIMLLLISGVHSVAWGQRKDTLPTSKDTLTEQLVQSSRKQVDAAIYFRIGESHIDPKFEGNNIRLDLFLTKLQQVLADSNYVVNHIKVVGTASPDGAEKRNLQLANERAHSLAAYIEKQVSVEDSLQIEVINGGENWAGLRAMIEHSHMPYKDDMLRLMDKYRDNPKARKRALQYYANSKPWLWMYNNFFPALRKGGGGVQLRKDSLTSKQPTVTETETMTGSGITFYYDSAHHNLQHDSVATQHAINKSADSITITDLKEIVTPTIRTAKRMYPIFAIKTDLVQWIGITPAFDGLHAITPNLGVEFYFADRWSVEASYSYSNWNAITGNKCLWAVSQGSIEPRYWLQNGAVFRGFYLGAYGNYGSYDAQTPTTGNTGTFYGVGVTAGYLHLLSKHWAIELGVRGGYRSASNDFYDIKLGHYYHQASTMNNQFVPQVKLSVVYRIFRESN